jgi:hypothetical protein
MWEIIDAPNKRVVNTIRSLEEALPPEDAALVAQVKFVPPDDSQLRGNRAVSLPWEKLLLWNDQDLPRAAEMRAALAHEVGHFVDWHTTEWKWHDPFPPSPLDPLATMLKDRFSEYFASGYAIKQGFMKSEDDWRGPLQDFADCIRRNVREGIPPQDWRC